MIRQLKFSYITLITFSALFVSCNSSDSPIIDQEAPLINIISPQTDINYDPGSMVLLMVEITENLELHEYAVMLKHEETNTKILLEAGHSHEKTILIEKEIQIPNFNVGHLLLIVEAEDHDGNFRKEQIQLKINN